MPIRIFKAFTVASHFPESDTATICNCLTVLQLKTPTLLSPPTHIANNALVNAVCLVHSPSELTVRYTSFAAFAHSKRGTPPVVTVILAVLVMLVVGVVVLVLVTVVVVDLHPFIHTTSSI